MGQAAIFGGNYVKTLKDKINLFDKAYIVTGTADPTSVATAGPKGSIYLRQGTIGAVYVKQDDGLTTNWSQTDYSSPSSFNLTNNQSSPADITGLIADSTNGIGFNLEYGIRRSFFDTSVDTAFYTNLGTAINNIVFTITNQPDDKILVGGQFTTLNGSTRNRLVRLNADGTQDAAFYTNLGTAFGGTVRTTAIQSDDKILVGGSFATFNGNTRNYLVRLNADGTEDAAFYTNLGTGFDNTIYTTAIQSDGKIIVGGGFITFNGNTRKNLVRLNTNGTEDAAFYTNLGTSFDTADVYTTAIQSDDKILVGGSFATFNGNTRNYLVRLNADGTEDAAFYTNLGTGFNGIVRTIVIQPDGKIIVGGTFTTFNGNSRKSLVRLNTNGTEDAAFYTNLGTAFNSDVFTTAIQSDGKIIVGGLFTNFNGSTRNRIVRLNADGTEDAAFYTNLGTAFNSIVYTISIQSDNNIIAGGQFTAFSGNTRNRITRFATSELTKQGSLRGLYRASTSTWELGGEVSIGDDVGVTFSITNDGQVQYTSTDLSGSVNSLKCKMIKT